jgi:hypothetical protein
MRPGARVGGDERLDQILDRLALGVDGNPFLTRRGPQRPVHGELHDRREVAQGEERSGANARLSGRRPEVADEWLSGPIR